MSDSLLLNIGIDEYQDRCINKLSYCVFDCFRMERFFKVFNIANSFTRLANNQATQTKILMAIRSSLDRFENIYIYYSSHGKSVNNQTYLYAFDTNENDLEATSINISNLIDLFSTSSSKKITVIIDACDLIEPKHQLNNLTIYYPKVRKVYEDSSYKQGLFTKEILNTLSIKYSYIFSQNNIGRYQRIRQDLANLLESENIVLICGKSGLGKSYLLRQIKHNEKHTFYISLPKVEGLTFDIILNLIQEELCLLEKDEKFLDSDSERYIRFYSNSHPYILLIIDHIDHLGSLIKQRLLNFLSELQISIIMASKESNPLICSKTYYVPKLTPGDIYELVKEYGINEHDFFSKLSNYKIETYIDILECINSYHFNQLTTLGFHDLNSKKVQKALAVSGGFINKDLFTQTFGLDKKVLDRLIDLGQIVLYDKFYYPHDSIYENMPEFDLEDTQRLACNYWKNEFINNPSSIKAIQNFILLANSFSLDIDPNETEMYKAMIKAMLGRQNTYFFLMLNEHIKHKDLALDLRILMCETLIDIGKFSEALDSIQHCSAHNHRLAALIVELYWWQGKFDLCISEATKLLSQSIDSLSILHLYNSRGIGYFFIGKWDLSTQDFDQVLSSKNDHIVKYKFLSYCVLATIQGIRGTDFLSSVDNFINSIAIAKRAGKLSWLAIAYGNIGEILWKAGYYDKSIEVLQISGHLAYLTNNDPLYLEINRNLLHAYRRNTLFVDAEKQLKKIEEILNFQSDNYVKIQVVNTLITHYVLTGNVLYKNQLPLAEHLTKNNDEYYIYTLANFAIVSLAENKIIPAINNMNQALTLCQTGKNWLAIKQILEDWDAAIKFYQFESHLLSLQFFQKWHQILEKELLPCLHHLSRLCEYLEYP